MTIPPVSPRRPIRVLHVLDSFAFGGAENLVAELGAYAPLGLDVQVASVTVAGDRDHMLERLSRAGLNPTHLGVPRLAAPLAFLRLARRLRRMRRAGQIDVVHAHLETSAVVAAPAARLAGIPCVVTLHHHPADLPWRVWLKERLAVRIAERCGLLVLVSGPAYDEFARRHGPARGSWRMVHNGVDTDRYRPRSGDAAADVREHPDSGPVWLALAALRREKGHLDLLEAWAAVHDRHPEARLWIAGEGVARAEIEEAERRLDLSGCVRLLGARDDAPELLRQVDGVVSASWTEALPTALIEASAAGLPVVATAAGGTTEVVADGETGLLVPVRDVLALTRALLRCLDDADLGRRLGSAGRERAVTAYSMGTWSDRLAELYREVGAGGQPARPATVRRQPRTAPRGAWHR